MDWLRRQRECSVRADHLLRALDAQFTRVANSKRTLSRAKNGNSAICMLVDKCDLLVPLPQLLLRVTAHYGKQDGNRPRELDERYWRSQHAR